MKKTYTKKSAADRKAEMQQITEMLENGVKTVFETDEFTNYLKLCSRIHHYSLNNQILICMQNPDASLCMAFSKWPDYCRHVKKGEHGLKILAPIIKKHCPRVGEEEEDEPKEVLVGFKQVYTFDISQTSGDPLPIISMELTGDVAEIDRFISATKKIVKIPVTFEDIKGSAFGYFSPAEKKIVIKKDLSQLQTLKTLLHEAAHSMLHGDTSEKKSREQKETEAEAVAFVVSQHFGIDTSDYSFKYLATWASGKETPELKASLETIRKTSADFIDQLEEILSQDPEPSPEGDGSEKTKAETIAAIDKKIIDTPVTLVTVTPKPKPELIIKNADTAAETLAHLLDTVPEEYILTFTHKAGKEKSYLNAQAYDMRKVFPLVPRRMKKLIKTLNEDLVYDDTDTVKNHIKTYLELVINNGMEDEFTEKMLKANLEMIA